MLGNTADIYNGLNVLNKSIKINITTLFVMACILSQLTLSAAATEFIDAHNETFVGNSTTAKQIGKVLFGIFAGYIAIRILSKCLAYYFNSSESKATIKSYHSFDDSIIHNMEMGIEQTAAPNTVICVEDPEPENNSDENESELAVRCASNIKL